MKKVSFKSTKTAVKRLFSLMLIAAMFLSMTSPCFVTAEEYTEEPVFISEESAETENGSKVLPVEDVGENTDAASTDVPTEESSDEDDAVDVNEPVSQDDQYGDDAVPADFVDDSAPSGDDTDEADLPPVDTADNDITDNTVADVPIVSEAKPAQSFEIACGDVTVEVSAPKGAFPEGTVMEVKPVDDSEVIDAINNAVKGESRVVKAVDISFYCDGNEIEPDVPIQVSLKSAEIAQTEEPVLVHVDDNGEAEVVKQLENTDEDEVAFESNEFSIYAVVGGQGDEARATVNFHLNGGTTVTMYVKNDDSLEELKTILYDPGSGTLADDELFIGWVKTSSYNSSTTVMTIEEVRTEMANMAITEGDVVDYYAAVAKIVTLTYFDEAGVSVVKQESKQLIGTDANVSFNVVAAYTPSEATENFEGWKVKSGSGNIVSPAVPTGEDDCYENGTTLTVTGSVELIAYAPQGRWLIFDENGTGGKYNAPKFVRTGHVTQPPCDDDDMTRKGYSFDAWYTVAYGDGDEPDTNKKFIFGSELEESITIYARWIPNETAPYTIIFWQQNINRNGYDLKASYPGNGTVGQYIPYTSVDNKDEDYATLSGVAAATYHYTGFCLNDSSKNQQVTITADGEAVLNLYYNRIEYDLRFYYYRERGNGRNRFSFANNSAAGNNVWGIASWHTGENEHPTQTYGDDKTDTVEGYTAHYFVLHAYYGQDISSIWPKYDQLTGVGSRQPVSFIMMVGTELKPRPSAGGDGTVKGVISTMDGKILGATNDSQGNFMIIRFPTSSNNWRYHIWYEVVDGENHTGEAGYTTRAYNGKTYYTTNALTLVVRSSNTDINQQNAPQYTGYADAFRRNQNWNGDGSWTTSGPTLYHINYVYNRLSYKISYFDGVYVDMDDENVVLAHHEEELFKTSEDIVFGSTIADSFKNYEPTTSHEDGYVFLGWYADAACSTPMTWSTMPVGGIKVYAKWARKEYRVLMHPNAGTSQSDPELNWGSDTVSTSFRLNYMGKVSTPTGVRPGYEFIGWFTDPDFENVFLNNTAVTDDNTAPYDQTDPTELDDWGQDTAGGVNKDADNNRIWIQRKLEIYAKWKKIAEGAPGISIVYVAEPGSEPPVDNSYYDDSTQVIAQGASKGYKQTEEVDGEEVEVEYVFDHWVVQKWNGSMWVDTEAEPFPGDRFEVKLDDAKATDASSSSPAGITKVYTIQLRAVYLPKDKVTPTHIDWYSNYGTENDGKGTLYRADDTNAAGNPLMINEGVYIYPGTTSAPTSTPTRTGYTFKGWTKTKGGTTADFLVWNGSGYLTYEGNHPVTQVAADERQPYEDLYAVWERLILDVTVKKIVSGNMGDSLKKFTINITCNEGETFTYNGETRTSLELQLANNEVSEYVLKVPAGVIITVRENDYTTVENGNYESPVYAFVPTDPDSTYDSTSTSSFEITESGQITVTNTKNVIPDTGITLTDTPFKVFFALATICGVGMFFRKRRSWVEE